MFLIILYFKVKYLLSHYYTKLCTVLILHHMRCCLFFSYYRSSMLKLLATTVGKESVAARYEFVVPFSQFQKCSSLNKISKKHHADSRICSNRLLPLQIISLD